MRRRISLLLTFLIIVIAYCLSAIGESGPRAVDLEAQNVLLVRLEGDLNSEETIYDLFGDELIYPASTMKMLTALTVLEIANPEEQVRVGLEYFLAPSDASKSGLKPLMKLSVRDLLKCLLLSSGADAAYALAAYCGRKAAEEENLLPPEAIAHFVEAMNSKASSLGTEHTTVVNADGYDEEGQLTTARDLLIIAKAFLDQPILAEICAIPDAEVNAKIGMKSVRIAIRNTNEMLHEDSVFYNRDVTGIKTGTTSLAGACLVSVFHIRTENYICVVMNSSQDGRYLDTQKLYEMCYSSINPHDPL